MLCARQIVARIAFFQRCSWLDFPVYALKKANCSSSTPRSLDVVHDIHLHIVLELLQNGYIWASSVYPGLEVAKFRTCWKCGCSYRLPQILVANLLINLF